MSLSLDEARFDADHFALFGLPPKFCIDLALLGERFRELQARAHPDRFAQASDVERRVSLQWATRINEAYQTLKNPLSRAQYLLARQGGADTENNTAMPPEFLMEQMEWREAVAEAEETRDAAGLDELRRRVEQRMNAGYEELAALLDESRAPAAAERVRRQMFLQKLLAEIDDGLAALEE